MVHDTGMIATGKIIFKNSGMWDPRDREEREQARCYSDLLFSYEDLNYGSVEESITESGLSHPGGPDEKNSESLFRNAEHLSHDRS